MKLTVNIDCTPEEARAFFGLPDVSVVNKIIVDGLAKRTEENLWRVLFDDADIEQSLAGLDDSEEDAFEMEAPVFHDQEQMPILPPHQMFTEQQAEIEKARPERRPLAEITSMDGYHE